MVIAGEASGDLHGARLVSNLRALAPDLDFFGIGGKALRKAGVHIEVDNSEIAVVGISEVLSKITPLMKALRFARQRLREFRPDLLILIDFPDFNFRVAAAAKRLGIPVMYYISPQIWAWRTGRIKTIQRLVDHMVVIFPFEVEFYERWNVPVTFVGHPLLDGVRDETGHDRPEGLKGDGLLVGLFPGSRDGEITRLLPTMVRVAEILSDRFEEIRFAIPVASSVDRPLVESIVRRGEARFLILSEGLRDILDEATLVITASGTATLETAIAGTPMIIIYKVSPISYWLARCMIRVKDIGLVNLVAQRRIVPEFVQYNVTAEKIADQAFRMIQDKEGLEDMRGELLRVGESLGAPGASRRAAEVALKMLAGR